MKKSLQLFARNGRRVQSTSLDFLIQTQDTNSLNRPAPGSQSPQHPQHPKEQIGNTAAISKISHAVLSSNWAEAEKIFESHPTVHKRPAALKWMLRSYCASGDFTTAKAMLFQVADTVGPTGACQLIARCATDSLNTRDVQEIYFRFRQHKQVLGLALLALRVLGDKTAFAKVWDDARLLHGEPRRIPEVQQVDIYDMLIAKDWVPALEKCRTVLAETYDRGNLFRARQPYTWAFRYFAGEGDWEALVQLAIEMETAGLPPKSDQFAAFVLESFPQKYPEVWPTEWLRICKDQGWPLGPQALSKAFDEMQSRYPSKYQTITEMRTSCYRAKSGVLPVFAKDPVLRALRKSPANALLILDDMCKKGRVPSYLHCVVAFEHLAKLGDRQALLTLTQRIEEWGYPKHCAGIDLSVVELVYREVKQGTDKEQYAPAGQQLVAEYLSQYPLVHHDRKQLTRLGRILLDTGDPLDAGTIVDSLRRQSPSMKYTLRTHDSASLELLARIRAASKEPLASFMHEVLQDRPLILLDPKFIREFTALLKYRHEPLTVIEDIHAHNASVSREIDKQLQNICTYID